MSTLSQLIHDKFKSGNSVEVDRIVITRAEYEAELAKPEQDKTQQALDKKADNARELGLDYEPANWAKTYDHVCLLLKMAHDILACTSFPPRKEWVGLTNDEKKSIYLQPGMGDLSEIQMYGVIEAKLKEKNT